MTIPVTKQGRKKNADGERLFHSNCYLFLQMNRKLKQDFCLLFVTNMRCVSLEEEVGT